MTGITCGVHLNPYDSFADLDEVREYVRVAEKLGYGFVLVPEHTIFGPEQEQRMGAVWWDAVTLVAHLASITERLRFMFSVLVLPHHHPIRLAKQLATLDQISDGRIDVGVGVGWLEEEFEALGVPFKERGARTDEYIDVMRALWSEHPVTFHGKYFQLNEMSFLPKPVQKPLPIWIGGSVEKSVRRSAERGDAWLPMGAPPEVLEAGLAKLRERLRSVGREIAGYPVLGRLPFWEASARTTKHAHEAGASRLDYYDGDLDRAKAHLEWAEKVGVSHMYVELPVDRRRRLDEMTRFAEAFLVSASR